LNVTVLVPLVAPKFAPVIVIEVPIVPLVGERLVRLGADDAGAVNATSVELELTIPDVL
jgi:hypothetical protein